MKKVADFAKYFDLLVQIINSGERILEMSLNSKAISDTVEHRSKAPAYRALPAYKAFPRTPLIIFCSTFYIGYKAFSLQYIK